LRTFYFQASKSQNEANFVSWITYGILLLQFSHGLGLKLQNCPKMANIYQPISAKIPQPFIPPSIFNSIFIFCSDVKVAKKP